MWCWEAAINCGGSGMELAWDVGITGNRHGVLGVIIILRTPWKTGTCMLEWSENYFGKYSNTYEPDQLGDSCRVSLEKQRKSNIVRPATQTRCWLGSTFYCVAVCDCVMFECSCACQLCFSTFALTLLPTTVRPQASISIDIMSNSSILELADQPEGWRSGDRVVVASTDYSMHQAEEFTVLPCPTCTSNQVKVQGERTSDQQYVSMQGWNERVWCCWGNVSLYQCSSVSSILNMFESWLFSLAYFLHSYPPI